jgi:hypothetical protein
MTQKRNSGFIRGREYVVLAGRISADDENREQKKPHDNDQGHPESTDSPSIPVVR